MEGEITRCRKAQQLYLLDSGVRQNVYVLRGTRATLWFSQQRNTYEVVHPIDRFMLLVPCLTSSVLLLLNHEAVFVHYSLRVHE